MSKYKTDCFLFLNSPRGGVEDFEYVRLKCPWVKGVICNIRDYPPEQWSTVRARALQNGLWVAPWGRTGQGADSFESGMVDLILQVGDQWGEPGVVNSEKELDGHQEALDYIITQAGPREIGLSVEPNPFGSISWAPVPRTITVLLQNFPAEQTPYDPKAMKAKWHSLGVECVAFTHGTYRGQTPDLYDLKSPYSLFTGDIPMATSTLEAWAPTSSGYIACVPEEVPVAEKEWWQVPYPKGAAVGPAKLPGGPFYPPDDVPPGQVPTPAGPAVLAIKRAMKRAQRWATTTQLSALNNQYTNPFAHGFGAMVKNSGIAGFQRQEGITPSGRVGDGTYQAIRRARVPVGPNEGAPLLDAECVKLLKAAAAAPSPLPLVEPTQSFDALHPSLWNLYSIGRSAPFNFTDLGCYNPNSRLPSGAISDHAVYPSLAFDLGIDPDTGWDNLEARRYVENNWQAKDCEYMILGNRIYVNGEGWHEYTSGGHDNHIHVSGRR